MDGSSPDTGLTQPNSPVGPNRFRPRAQPASVPSVPCLPKGQAFYRVSQVAKLLGYTPKQIYNLVQCGFLDACRIHPSIHRSRLRIPKSEVVRVLTARTRDLKAQGVFGA